MNGNNHKGIIPVMFPATTTIVESCDDETKWTAVGLAEAPILQTGAGSHSEGIGSISMGKAAGDAAFFMYYRTLDAPVDMSELGIYLSVDLTIGDTPRTTQLATGNCFDLIIADGLTHTATKHFYLSQVVGSRLVPFGGVVATEFINDDAANPIDLADIRTLAIKWYPLTVGTIIQNNGDLAMDYWRLTSAANSDKANLVEYSYGWSRVVDMRNLREFVMKISITAPVGYSGSLMIRPYLCMADGSFEYPTVAGLNYLRAEYAIETVAGTTTTHYLIPKRVDSSSITSGKACITGANCIQGLIFYLRGNDHDPAATLQVAIEIQGVMMRASKRGPEPVMYGGTASIKSIAAGATERFGPIDLSDFGPFLVLAVLTGDAAHDESAATIQPRCCDKNGDNIENTTTPTFSALLRAQVFKTVPVANTNGLCAVDSAAVSSEANAVNAARAVQGMVFDVTNNDGGTAPMTAQLFILESGQI